jgi:hypothetical protein
MAAASGDRESQGSSTEYGTAKPYRPALTFRDSTGSSIASRGSNGGDRHDVVRDLSSIVSSHDAVPLTLADGEISP